MRNTIPLLIKHSPEMIVLVDPRGRVPFRDACDNHIPLEFTALDIADNYGRLPLVHFAFEIVHVFVGERGCLPLYIACGKGTTLDVIYNLAQWSLTFVLHLILQMHWECSRSNGTRQQECFDPSVRLWKFSISGHSDSCSRMRYQPKSFSWTVTIDYISYIQHAGPAGAKIAIRILLVPR